MDSHIQMPKLMLRRFENDKHELYYYDLETHVLGKGSARSTNTEEDYYSEGMESLLNRSIETPFSKVLRYIDAIDFDSDSFSLFSGFEKTVKDFLKALFVRNPNNVDEIEKHSIFFQLCDERSKHDVAVWMGMEEAYSQALYDLFFPTFCVNQSDTPFVLPISGSYGFTHNGIKHINLPIDPKTAITLIDKKKVETIIKDETVHLYLITNDKQAEKFNMMAYENQQRLGYGRVVSNRKDVLERLICCSSN